MSSGLLARSLTNASEASWVMWLVRSVATAPGSITVTRMFGWSSWRSDSDQPLIPHLVAA